MRKIQITGTAQAQAPLANGVTSWVVENEAYWLCKNGEATYARAIDTVSDARYEELRSLISAGTPNFYASKGLEAKWTAAQWEAQRGFRANDLTVPSLASLPAYRIRVDL